MVQTAKPATEGKILVPEGAPLDPFLEMFEKAIAELNQRYVDGVTEYLQKNHPRLQAEIDKTEGKLNEVWRAGREGKAGIEEFRQILDRWRQLHIKGIEIYAGEW